MRADAARRRHAIVQAARHLFAADGTTVALDSIAEASGVGIATLYRNFDSRAALADEVAQSILRDMQQAATQALAAMDEMPDAAWSGYIDRLVELDLGALSATLSDFMAGEMSPALRDAQASTLAGVEALLARARDSGLVRADLNALELVLAVGMITRPQPEVIRDATPELVTKLVRIFLDGLRPRP